MEILASTGALMVILIFIFLQDFRRRTIHIFLPISLFLLSVIINYNSIDLEFITIVYNIVFILINIIGLFFYFSLKNKKIVNPIDSYLGLGDVVFFIAITPLFNLKPFILFFISGLLFSLLLHFGVMLFKKVKTIPLAGYLSLFLILNLVTKSLFKINLYF